MVDFLFNFVLRVYNSRKPITVATQVGFNEGEKPKNSEKKYRNTGETNRKLNIGYYAPILVQTILN